MSRGLAEPVPSPTGVMWETTVMYLSRRPVCRHACSSMPVRRTASDRAESSLHGPDPRHASPGFKFGNDASFSKAEAASVNTGDPLPWWFPGKQDINNLVHAVRIFVPATTLVPGAPSGDVPGAVRNRTAAGLLPTPPDGHSAMLDLYVSDGPPEFPIRARLDELDALLGPIVNKAGQNLSGVTRILPDDRLDLTHLDSTAPLPSGPQDAVRGVQCAVAPDGVLWLVERVLSVGWLNWAGARDR